MTYFPDLQNNSMLKTDASDYHMGGVVSQNGNPIGFFSQKFNSAQLKYPTIEQELLALVETLKYFCWMLLGQRVTVCTNHKNLIGVNTIFTRDRVLRQQLSLEEYGVTLKYIREGKIWLPMHYQD